ncbi:ATP12-domain-containing protein [Tilletiaria anomala UBC 951]|uniref:ATP12-domain-containing protein n=1 Tax=Tilletiaria anomala (strain ATCC 24038 / CBS 436.72 / UBC 951) TaxID=1037660 RepID=A0A066WQE5_TILAU|nr:ATP12-domain-containing protein [Tilletiaria anomala UBC 951]KDN53234.1 ATP12-domain-containing protein [Tilletiaria anomala UBC 951]
MSTPAALRRCCCFSSLRTGRTGFVPTSVFSASDLPGQLSYAIRSRPRALQHRVFSQSCAALDRGTVTSKVSDDVTAKLKDSATSQAERSMRRFWKEVTVARNKGNNAQEQDEPLVVQLDSRSLKTPAGSLLKIPVDRPLLAALIAQEWDEQDRVLRPHALPLTSLAARALDGMASPSQREAVCKDLLRYLETDTICFHESKPPVLVRLQKEHWEPILAWVKERFGVEIKLYDGITISTAQDSATKQRLLEHISTLSPLQLAAFERAVMTSKSFLIALALVEGRLDVEGASRAAEVEVRSQIERWGEVEDTHDVDHHDVRRMLGSVAVVLARDQDHATIKHVCN